MDDYSTNGVRKRDNLLGRENQHRWPECEIKTNKK